MNPADIFEVEFDVKNHEIIFRSDDGEWMMNYKSLIVDTEISTDVLEKIIPLIPNDPRDILKMLVIFPNLENCVIFNLENLGIDLRVMPTNLLKLKHLTITEFDIGYINIKDFPNLQTIGNGVF